MPNPLGHERLQAYQQALRFVAWMEPRFAGVDRSAAALDHLARASESVVAAIANGNSRRSASDRNRYFDIAVGSALECAACLDVCRCKQLITTQRQVEGKHLLLPTVRMTIGLRKTKDQAVREEGTPYGADLSAQPEAVFFHETLEVYQRSLELVGWLDALLRSTQIAQHRSNSLDATTTSLVLNIAEGNGRFNEPDHLRFLDIAHTAAMNTAAGLDLLTAKALVRPEQVSAGKLLLHSLVPLLLGLRRSLYES